MNANVGPALRAVNEWWDYERVPKELVPRTRRTLFEEVVGLVDDRRITAIMGPRRTGKTTLLYQTIDHLIASGAADPRHILMITGDDPALKGIEDPLGSALDYYYKDHLKEHPRDSPSFVFIDEVHKLKEWQLHLKAKHDAKHKVKFFVSGSSAVRMKRSERESLAGRISELLLLPMDFNEFMAFSGHDVSPFRGMRWSAPHRVVELLDSLDQRMRNRIRSAFDTYALVGGFPEWFETKGVRRWQVKLREDAIKRVVYDDIAGAYGLRNPEKLESLLHLVSSMSARSFSENSVARAIRTDNETAGKYTHYLKESFLLLEFSAFSASRVASLRKNRKYVLVDVGLKNALERTTRIEDLGEGELGVLVEGIVARHLHDDAEAMSLTPSFLPTGRGEVDYIIHGPKKRFAVEVKYRHSVRQAELQSLSRMLTDVRPTSIRVVSRDECAELSLGLGDAGLVPAWLFLACSSEV